MNYLHKDFASVYGGNFEDDPTGQAYWESSDIWNPDGRASDKNSFVPLSFGAGVKAWLSNSFGLGLQVNTFCPCRRGFPTSFRFLPVSSGVLAERANMRLRWYDMWR